VNKEVEQLRGMLGAARITLNRIEQRIAIIEAKELIGGKNAERSI